jgi:hypothetical protein
MTGRSSSDGVVLCGHEVLKLQCMAEDSEGPARGEQSAQRLRGRGEPNERAQRCEAGEGPLGRDRGGNKRKRMPIDSCHRHLRCDAARHGAARVPQEASRRHAAPIVGAWAGSRCAQDDRRRCEASADVVVPRERPTGRRLGHPVGGRVHWPHEEGMGCTQKFQRGRFRIHPYFPCI